MQAGEVVRVTAMRYDGTPYRWWDVAVEEARPELVVAFAAAGSPVYQPDGTWNGKVNCRFYYWPDRPYNLVEVSAPDGKPLELYVHIASAAVFCDGEIRYHDYELDVVRWVGKPPEVLDEDEFAAAAGRYGYSPEFQAGCRKAVAEALELVQQWEWIGAK